MLTAVILGAFGAHGLKTSLSGSSLEVFKTAVFYQFIHSLGIFVVIILSKLYDLKKLKYSFWLFTLGIIFFSGSLYFLATKSVTGFGPWLFGPMTPIGGLFFVLGWVWMIVVFLQKKNL